MTDGRTKKNVKRGKSATPALVMCVDITGAERDTVMSTDVHQVGVALFLPF